MKTQSLFARSIVLAALCAALTLPAPIGAVAEDEGDAFELSDIFVVGTRRPVRSTADTPAPIDLIGGEDFTDQGTTNLTDTMRTLVPSYNVNPQPISDEATFIRPANLRGLAPDQTLVFVNGKRRHRAAVISYLGNGVSDGAQGPDIGVIPAIALERVEVLRDTASAQYGSDAIAGVINFVLKSRPDGGAIETQWGRTYENDGESYRIATNVGVPISESGFANLSAQWHESEPTVRSVQRGDAERLIAAGNTGVRQPYAQIWGAPDIRDDYTVFVNSGMDVSETAEIYAFGNVSGRETEGGFFFRNPNNRSGVYHKSYVDDRMVSEDDPQLLKDETISTRLLGDPDGDPDACDFAKEFVEKRMVDTDDGPKPKDALRVDAFRSAHPDLLIETGNEMADLEAIRTEYPDCFAFNQLRPSGFTPSFRGTVSDTAGTGGVRGALDSGLTWDLSYTWGRSSIDYFIRNTINPSLGQNTRFEFDLGTATQTEQVLNADLTYAIDVTGFDSPLHTAAGLEWRREEFAIVSGEPDSWRLGPLANQGFGVGANGFAGFPPSAADTWRRDNTAAYIDLEADVRRNVTLAAMGRAERYDDFGTTTDFKLGARFQMTDQVAVRGSASTGFRAPTLGQSQFSKVTTEFGERLDGTFGLRQSGTVAPSCSEAVEFGADPLTPEESVTFTAGVVAESGALSLTADIYNIDVDDRLAVSKDYTIEDQERKNKINQRGNACFEALDVREVKFFGNALDTRTRGVDVVASVDLSEAAPIPGDGETEFVVVGSYVSTEVKRFEEEFLDEKRLNQLEKALPKFRFNATLRHEQARWSGFARLNYYGAYEEYHADVEAWLYEAGREFTLDAEVAYAPVEGLRLSIGAENILNNFPDENPFAKNLGSLYPESSPMGFAGGFYYARARYVF